MKTFLPGQRLRFDYINHRDVVERRDVIFKGLDFGSNEWYPEKQWFMHCYDCNREADRSFLFARIDGHAIEVVSLGLLKAVEALATPAPQCACGGPCHRCAGKCGCTTCSHGAA